jgi:hypothetical protein
VVAALIGGCIGYVIGDEHSRIQAAAAGANAAGSGCGAGKAPDPSATSPAGSALLTRLLPMPSGASTLKLNKLGELSLDDYIQNVYSGAAYERQRLTAICFQVAVHSYWQLPSGTAVSIYLIQFGSNADARSYVLGTEQGDSGESGNTVTFTVPGVADGMGIADPTLDKDGNTLTHLLSDRGDVAILIHVYVPARLDNAAGIQVMQQQYARL